MKQDVTIRTVKLERARSMYDLNVHTWRKRAAREGFPGLFRPKGTRFWYVDLAKFDVWFRGNTETTGDSSK